MTGRRTWLIGFVAAAVLLLGGCAVTGMAYDEATGGKAQFDFVLVDDAMPKPRILWRELPVFASTMRTLEPDLPGCERVTFFVNPEESAPNLVGIEPTRVQPAVWQNEADLLGRRQLIPDDPCAIAIFAGTIQASQASGVFAYTSTGASHTLFDAVPVDAKGDANFWFLLPFAMFYEPVSWMSAGFRAYDAQNEVADTVTLTFEFPDRDPLKVALDYERAMDLLEPQLYVEPHPSPDIAPWNARRFWVWAALLERGLDFREAADDFDSRMLPDFVSIDGHVAEWCVMPRDATMDTGLVFLSIEHHRDLVVREEPCWVFPDDDLNPSEGADEADE